MSRRIAIIQGHPDAARAHYGHALAAAYEASAKAAGHEIRRIDVAKIALMPLRRKADWEAEPDHPALREAQEIIQWAEHLVILS